ncbi:uncharacterized protein LOC133032410 [Cannabis sativa]|uniref:uncharacterized protein LOC133032410 n=1 Tax=Cannabis sativa TaxID=3483 RepID=UPI0029CAA99A|nr:uncharacterized protein LOC133032410 [Cannabis sativa]
MAISVRSKISKKFPIEDVSRPLCGTEDESLEHLFLSCNVAFHLWRFSPWDHHASLFPCLSPSLADVWVIWVQTTRLEFSDALCGEATTCCKALDIAKDLGSKFIIINSYSRVVINALNKKESHWVLENYVSFCTRSSPVFSARSVLATWKIANFESPHAYFAKGDVTNRNLWAKPYHDNVKVNVDGAIFEAQQEFGYGWVARNSNGTLIEAVSGSRLDCVLPEIAEVIGIKEALSWIKGKGWDKVVVEFDALVVVQAITSTLHMSSQFGLLVEDCRLILSTLNNVQIKFVNRSANRVAYYVARGSCFSSDRTFYRHNAPSSLRDIVIADAS